MSAPAIATQGGEGSYHALAARLAMQGREVVVDGRPTFEDVVVASRQATPGLGVVAVRTAMGPVDASVAELVMHGSSGLPCIVGRVDVPIELALISSRSQDLADLAGRGTICLAQLTAASQCQAFLTRHLPQVQLINRDESCAAVKEVVAKGDPSCVAIGPAYSAEVLGGHIVGPRQINAVGSITSFYVLQRDPRQQLLPVSSMYTRPRSVFSVSMPLGEREFGKCLRLAKRLGLEVTRFIPFAHSWTQWSGNGWGERVGGLLELAHELYDVDVWEFVARMFDIRAADGRCDTFKVERLGEYPWHDVDAVERFKAPR